MTSPQCIDTSLPGRTLPVIDVDNAPFFEAAAQGILLLQRCRDTGRFQHYPRPGSIFTAGPIDWVAASGRGTVYSRAIVRQNFADPVFAKLVPYVVALIELEEHVRMMGNVIGCDVNDVAIGMAVRVHFACVDADAGIHLPFWKPA